MNGRFSDVPLTELFTDVTPDGLELFTRGAAVIDAAWPDSRWDWYTDSLMPGSWLGIAKQLLSGSTTIASTSADWLEFSVDIAVRKAGFHEVSVSVGGLLV